MKDSKKNESLVCIADSSPIVVAGMHRSGTSLIASMLSALGVGLGDRLVPPDRSNPRGYFEDVEILALNREMLGAATAADDGGHPDWGWTESGRLNRERFDSFRERARALIDARNLAAPSGSSWGWKDPRTTLALEFWDSIVPVARYVLVYRHPWEVADSMQRLGAEIFLRRPDYAWRIWHFYNSHLLGFYRRHKERALLVSANATRLNPEQLLGLFETRLSLNKSRVSGRNGVTINPDLFQSSGKDDPLPALAALAHRDSAELLMELDRAADLSGAGLWNQPRLPSRAHQSKKVALRVSIIIPCYNHGEYLIEAVASVERSVEEPCELIIVNDGSNEPRTLEVLDLLREAGYHVLNQKNRGLSAARNSGIKKARSPYILPLDADNRLRPGFVTAALAILDTLPEVGVVYGDRRDFGMRNASIRVPAFDAAALLQCNFIDACALLRKEVWSACGGYDTALPALEDWDLWIGAVARGWKFHYLPGEAFDYRVRPDSIIGLSTEEQRREVNSYVVAKHHDLYFDRLPQILVAAQRATAELFCLTIDYAHARAAPDFDAERSKQLAGELAGRLSEIEKRRQAESITHLAEIRELSAKAEKVAASLKTSEAELEKTRKLFHARSVSLAESEARSDQLRAGLRRQLQATKKLSRLLDDLEIAAGRLRSSRRWQIVNPIAALKEKISPGRGSLGYGHLEMIVSAYRKWLTTHPEVAAIDDQVRMLALGAIPPATSAPGRVNKLAMVEHVPLVPTKPIEFPIHKEVEISVVIPVFNQLRFTQACLASLQENQDAERFEVIVVDDGSTDATSDVIGKIRGLVYLRNESNSGFTSSCNRGAKEARGSYLLFLNNDTTVTPGWLSALRETLGNEPNAGLVGSKLVFPDGRLQEAGGIIWKDGSGWNRGKFGDAEKPEYNFLREVDYCSAACVMIPKSLFERVGGFDSKYSPAYYEDTDLAFKIRREGFKVFYQPLSKVVHHEGATGGTDLQTGAKKFQEINRATFVSAWADVLAGKSASGDLGACDRLRPEQKRILVIDHHVPTPDRDSGSLRMFQILKILHGLGHRVTFLGDYVGDIPPYGAELQKRGIEVVCHPYVKSVGEYLVAHGPEFDVVVLSRCDIARLHIANVRQYAPQSRIIFDTVDLHFLRDSREAELTQDADAKLIARNRQQLECEMVDQTDETWVVSPVEQELLRSTRPHKSIEIVSNIVDVPGFRTPFSLRFDFLFIGSFEHRPNIDAVLFFTEEIYPAVKQRLPNAKFYVIGDKAPPEVASLACEDVVVSGWQPDVRPYFENVKLSVAPLRWGAGVKGKINQSMAFGVPVVGTSLAVEGMNLTNREDVMVADEPDQFANAVIELYESEELWNRISRNGVEKTKALFSCEVAEKQLQRLFSDRHIAAGPKRRTDVEGIKAVLEFENDSQNGAAP